MAITYNLLPKNYFSSWQRLCIEIAVYNLLKKIYVIQNKDKITLFFIIDISKIYTNMSYKYLLHNLYKRKIDYKVIKQVVSFFTNY